MKATGTCSIKRVRWSQPQVQCILCAQAQQATAIHAKQAQQAREELEDVRRRAADSIRASSVSTVQLRELEELRGRLLDAESSTAGSTHALQAWHLSSACQSPSSLTLLAILTCTCPDTIQLYKPSRKQMCASHARAWWAPSPWLYG